MLVWLLHCKCNRRILGHHFTRIPCQPPSSIVGDIPFVFLTYSALDSSPSLKALKLSQISDSNLARSLEGTADNFCLCWGFVVRFTSASRWTIGYTLLLPPFPCLFRKGPYFVELYWWRESVHVPHASHKSFPARTKKRSIWWKSWQMASGVYWHPETPAKSRWFTSVLGC